MLMKVFNKGQVVIPAEVRQILGIQIGEMLEVQVNKQQQVLEIKKPVYHAENLAGSLAEYSTKPFPSNSQMHEALANGLSHEK